MFEIERNKEYEIKLMPNYFDVSNHIQTVDSEKNKLFKIYVSYFLNDEGKIDIIRLPKMIIEYIQKCYRGFYGTSEGYYLCGLEAEGVLRNFYYANKDKSEICLYDNEIDKNVQRFTKYYDIIEYKRFILCDLRGEYKLHFKTCDVMGFMKVYNIGLTKCEPLYKEGDDKNKILSLYDNVYQLKDYYKYLLNEERKEKIKSIL